MDSRVLILDGQSCPPTRDALLPRALSSFLIASLLVSLLAIFMEWLVRGRFGVD